MAEPRAWTCVCGQANAGVGPCSRCLNPAPAFVVASALADPRRDLGPPRWLRSMAVVVALLLVAGVLAAVVEGADDGASAVVAGQQFTVSADEPPPALAGAAGAVAAEVHALMRFVEKARGLPFERPVEVSLLADAGFRDRLAGGEESSDGEEAEDDDSAEHVLRALGLLERGIDLDEASEAFVGDVVAGFYDPSEDDLVVRGEELTPSVRLTLVHELTHALQDQHFDIDESDDAEVPTTGDGDAPEALDEGEEEEDESEPDEAFRSLVEGDAVRIEQLYTDSLPVEEQKAAELEEIENAWGIDPSTPDVLFELFGFPYAFGPAFARRVFESGGQARLDAAYREARPTSTEHILHPDRYLEGSTTKEVDAPSVDEELIDEGVLGEYGFVMVLRRLVEIGVAVKAAEGWGGDRYVAWRDGDDACVQTNVAMDSKDDASEMVTALRRAAKERSRMTVAATAKVITFTMCG